MTSLSHPFSLYLCFGNDDGNDNNDNNDDDNIIEGDDYGDGKEQTVLVFCDEPWNGHKNDKTAMMTL